MTIVKQDEVEWILGRKLEEFAHYVGTCTNTAQETLNNVSDSLKKGLFDILWIENTIDS